MVMKCRKTSFILRLNNAKQSFEVIRDRLRERALIEGVVWPPQLDFLGAERVLQRLRGIRGQDDATETGRRATPQIIVDIVRNRTLK